MAAYKLGKSSIAMSVEFCTWEGQRLQAGPAMRVLGECSKLASKIANCNTRELSNRSSSQLTIQ